MSQIAEKIGQSLLGLKSKAETGGAGLETMGQKAKLASVEADALGLKAQVAADSAAKLQAKAQAAGDGAGLLATKASLASKEAETLGIKAQLAATNAQQMGVEAETAGSRLGILSGIAGAARTGVLALAAAAVAAAAAVGSTVPAAAAFQSATNLLHTQANVSVADLARIRQGLLDMAPAVGIGPTELANGFYHVASALTQLPPALRNVTDELKVYQSAAELSKIGNASLEDSTQAVIGALAAYGKQGLTAADAAAQLNAIVGAGDMRMQQLTAAMTTGILPAAATFGISLKDVGAALATLTDNVTPADEAATRLRMTFSMIGAPTGAAQRALAAIGINATQLGYDLRKQPDGLLVAITDLKDHLSHIDASQLQGGLATAKDEMEKLGFTTNQVDQMVGKLGPDATEQAVILARAFGGGRSSAAILTLLTEFDSFKEKFGAITSGANNFQDAWASTTRTAEYQWSRFVSVLQADAIRVGTVLLPPLTTALEHVTDWLGRASGEVGPAIGRVGSVVGGIAGGVGSFLGGLTSSAAGAPAIPTFVGAVGPAASFSVGGATIPSGASSIRGAAPTPAALGSEIGAFVSGPLQALRAVTQTVLGAVTGWWRQHGQQVMGVLHALGTEISSVFHQAMSAIMGIVQPALQGLQGWWKTHGDEVMAIVNAWWGMIQEIFRIAAPVVVAVVKVAWAAIKDTVRTVFDIVVGVIRIAWDIISTIFNVALDLLTGHTDRAWADLKGGVQQLVSDVESLFNNLWNDVVRMAEDAASSFWNLGQKLVQAIIGGINSLGGAIGGAIHDWIANAVGGQGSVGQLALQALGIPGFQEGGKVPGPLGAPMLAVVHGGEVVVPADVVRGSATTGATTSGGSTLNSNTTIVLQLDGQVLATVIDRRIDRRLTGHMTAT